MSLIEDPREWTSSRGSNLLADTEVLQEDITEAARLFATHLPASRERSETQNRIDVPKPKVNTFMELALVHPAGHPVP